MNTFRTDVIMSALYLHLNLLVISIIVAMDGSMNDAFIDLGHYFITYRGFVFFITDSKPTTANVIPPRKLITVIERF